MASECNLNVKTICVMGHSFIRRLKDFVAASEYRLNLNLNDDSYKSEFRARGGLTLGRLTLYVEFLSFNKPLDACFIQIWGNALCHKNQKRCPRTYFNMCNIYIMVSPSLVMLITSLIVWFYCSHLE